MVTWWGGMGWGDLQHEHTGGHPGGMKCNIKTSMVTLDGEVSCNTNISMVTLSLVEGPGHINIHGYLGGVICNIHLHS